MAKIFGDKQRFSIEVGEFFEGNADLRCVDLWAAGRLLTCDDNTAFVPQFCMSVRSTLDWLRSGCDLSLPFPGLSPSETHQRLLASGNTGRDKYWFLQWGPTTDNVMAHVFKIGDRLIIPFQFWRPQHPGPEKRGQVFVAELPERELIDVLERALAVLDCNHVA